MAQDAIDLKGRPHEDSFLRVKTVVEVEGSLTTVGGDAKPQTVPIKVDAELFYDQRGLDAPHKAALRHYWEAKATLDINKTVSERKLRKARQAILLSDSIHANRFTSPLGPLTREELELVDVTTSGFPLEDLLPENPVDIDATWEHNQQVVQQLLRLDELTSGSLTSKLIEVTNEIARVEISGKVTGKADGSSTEMEITGNYQVHVRERFVKWFAISMKEKREAGFMAPGFEVVGRIRSACEKIDDSAALTTAEVTSLGTTASEGDRLLEFRPEDNAYGIALDRRWHILSQRGASTALRMIHDGELVATCRVDRLNKMPPGKQLMLTSYQRDVQQALGTAFEQIVSTETTVNPHGLRVLRVVASGNVNKAPIQWTYCHLSNRDGYCVSCIFTHEASAIERLGGLDDTFVNSMEIFEPAAQQARRTNAVAR